MHQVTCISIAEGGTDNTEIVGMDEYVSQIKPIWYYSSVFKEKVYQAHNLFRLL